MSLSHDTESQIKADVNTALDLLDSVGFALAELEVPHRYELTRELNDLLKPLEKWKARVWTELEAMSDG